MKSFALVILACLFSLTSLCQNKEITDPAYLNEKAKEQQNQNYLLDPDGEYITTYPSTIPRNALNTKEFQDSVRSYLKKHFLVKAKEAHCSKIVVHFPVENLKKPQIRKYDVWRLEKWQDTALKL
jgi:hypothetical protein